VNRKLLSLIFALLLSLCLAPSLRAQEAPRELYKNTTENRARLSQVMAPTANVEEFRREYGEYLAELQQVISVVMESPLARKLTKLKGIAPAEQLAAARRALPGLSAQDLTLLRAALAKSPSWRAMPQALNSLFRPEVRSGLKAMSVKVGVTANGETEDPAGITLEGGVTPDNCADAFVNGAPRISNTDIAAAEAAVIAAHAVMEALPTDVLTFEAHAAAGAAVAAVEATALTLTTFKAISDDCSGQAFENYVTTNLDTTVSSRATQTSVNNVQNFLNDRLDVKVSTRATQTSVDALQGDVDTANANINIANLKLDTLLVNLANFQAQHLRLQIEENLAAGTNDAAIGQFELPASKGGHLELARAITLETIDKLQAAGQNVRNARAFLAKGDQYRAAGKYKDAYDQYRQAYRTATGH
jgi:hypothetical protein